VLELTDQPGKGQGKFDAALRYYKQMEDGIVDAILEANHNLAPARMATGSAQLEGWNRNRQTKIEPKPSDRELAVMRFDDASGKRIATLVNLTGHPTTIPSTVLKFSADYVGAMKTEIMARTGGAALFMQGAAGDQSVVASGARQGYEAFGKALAAEAVRLADGIQPIEFANPSLQVREERFTFPSRVDFNNPIVLGAYQKAFFPELIPNFVDEYKNGVRARPCGAALLLRLLERLPPILSDHRGGGRGRLRRRFWSVAGGHRRGRADYEYRAALDLSNARQDQAIIAGGSAAFFTAAHTSSTSSHLV